jgi:1-hydroxycarotenoid 3,4-desaturase
MSSLRDNHPEDATQVVVVGAGIGGLVAALQLAAQGRSVTVVERADRPGGKLRQVMAGGHAVDSGPTVLTMRWVLDAIFESAGERLDDHLRLRPAEVLARHQWQDGSTLDLFADIDRTAEAIRRLAGDGDAAGYRAFCERTREAFETLDASFMQSDAPSMPGLVVAAGLSGLPALSRTRPFASLWRVVSSHFRDERLRQLFGRYATYCGSSPFRAPGPLMLIAHVEQRGVWTVDGGMYRIVESLVDLLKRRGVALRFGCEAAEILVSEGRAAGVRLADGTVVPGSAVVFNGDPVALATGLMGPALKGVARSWQPPARSLSALTWSLRGTARGFPLTRHTVFFSADYRREFAELDSGRMPQDPTVYVCAQDRLADASASERDEESLFVLVNAPSVGGHGPLSDTEMASCQRRVMARLAGAGLSVSGAPRLQVATRPQDFATMFPATAGALYGRASHGWAASFQRPTARTRMPGLFLAGGGVHPGPGLPMAAMSGRHAASATLRYLASTGLSHRAVMPGGMSTQSAMTAAAR